MSEDQDDTTPEEQEFDSATTILQRVIQSMSDAVPEKYFMDLTEREELEHRSAIVNAESIDDAVTAICKLIAVHNSRTLRRLLHRLDTNTYAHQWTCPTCGYRWGVHDPETMKCPSFRTLRARDIA